MPTALIREFECSLHPPSNILVPVHVDKIAFKAVLDTAGQVTVFSEAAWGKLHRSASNPREPILLKGAAIEGKMQAQLVRGVSLDIGGFTYDWDCCVAPISDELILGLDFLQFHHALIDLPNSLLSLGDNVIAIQIEPVEAPPPERSQYALKRTVTIQPFSAIRLPCFSFLTPPAEQVLVTVKTPVLGIYAPPIVARNGNALPLLLYNQSPHSLKVNPTDVEVFVEPLGVTPCVREVTDVRSSPPGGALTDPDRSTEVPEHVSKLLERSKTPFSPTEGRQLASLLTEFADVFAISDVDLGCLQGITHRIDTGDASPIKQRMRRTPLGFAAEEDRYLNSMIEHGVIRPSFSAWASPPVLVRKRDGSVRYCVDFRRLNDITKKDVFPLPLIEECVDALAGSKYFSTLDMASGYWQIRVEEEDKPKTAFVTKRGLFEHNRMAFGLCNAPATFQRAMNQVLEGLTWRTVLAYIDDIVVLGDSFDSHLANLRQVFQRFRDYNLKLKPRKCHLFQLQVNFLGRVISSEGIQVDPAKVERIIEWPTPSSAKEVASFLGLVNYHRDHIASYAHLAAPLYQLMKQDAEFIWTGEHTIAFSILKQAIASAPILAYPLPEGQFILDTDASDHAIGAELSQNQGGEVRVIAYSSYVLSPAQRNYCTTRKELLAVVRFTRVFRHYLLGRPFLVRTDHSSLTWLLRFKQIGGQLARWLEELSQYDMTVVHRNGVKHANADALSRIPDRVPYCDCYRAGMSPESLPCGGCKYCSRAHAQWASFEEEVDDVVPLAVRAVHVVDPDSPFPTREWRDRSIEIRREQNEDPDIGPVKRWLASGDPSPRELSLTGPLAKELWSQRNILRLHDGILCRRWVLPHMSGARSASESLSQLVVPRSLVRDVLETYHSLPLAGHPGVDRTLEKIRAHFYWPRMALDCKVYVATCAACSRNKKPSVRARAPLGSYHAGGPMERIHIDLLGPFPSSKAGNKYVLMVIDQFTKWLEAFAVPDQTTETVARVLVDEVFARLGAPGELHSDQGRNFQSDLFNSVCDLFQVTKTRTTPYRPCSNGQVERMNRTLLQMVRCFLQDDQTEWDSQLPQLAGAMRASVNRSTGFTANMLMLGREVSLPTDLRLPSPAAPPVDPATHLGRLQETLLRVHQAARENLQVAQRYQKNFYDQKARVRSYEVGDLVYVLDSSTQKGVAKKLSPVWEGPFLVTGSPATHLYHVRGPRRSRVLHHDRLKPFHEEVLPMWVRRARHHLLPGQTLPTSSTEPDPPSPPQADPIDNILPDLQILFQSPLVPPPVQQTASGRTVKLPARFL